jgi:hypothetical protein
MKLNVLSLIRNAAAKAAASPTLLFKTAPGGRRPPSDSPARLALLGSQVCLAAARGEGLRRCEGLGFRVSGGEEGVGGGLGRA